ncbi:hypothetical protein ACIA8O_18285 [Kitasatospora sp. NPDC051853]|uniref:hypothetical protein n=1 Tax=Kitasatospora sp. NPDC051853 TaxID=3364058 RepID=UPI0037A8570C
MTTVQTRVDRMRRYPYGMSSVATTARAGHGSTAMRREDGRWATPLRELTVEQLAAVATAEGVTSAG